MAIIFFSPIINVASLVRRGKRDAAVEHNITEKILTFFFINYVFDVSSISYDRANMSGLSLSSKNLDVKS